MKKKIIVIFKPINKKNDFYKNYRQNLKKNFSKVLIYHDIDNRFEKNIKSRKKLNGIKRKYDYLGIYLSFDKIVKINSFLYKIKTDYKNRKIFISPLFISGVITEEEFIFFELSKIYGMQFLRPELSFIKNRYILAKNLFKHIYEIKKKNKLKNENYIKLKLNYILSLESFSQDTVKKRKKKTNYFFYKLFLFAFRLIYKFEFDKKPKNYALIILGNDMNLNKLAENTKLKYFVKNFFNTFNYKIVFLFHPNTNIINFLRTYIKNKDIFFNNSNINFLQKPKNLFEIINNSKFIIHLTSSLSAQSLFYDKKIFCLGKNIMYLDTFNSGVIRLKNNKLKASEVMNKKINFYSRDKFLKKIFINSVNYNGDFKIDLDKRYFSSLLKKKESRIILNLLNSI